MDEARTSGITRFPSPHDRNGRPLLSDHPRSQPPWPNSTTTTRSATPKPGTCCPTSPPSRPSSPRRTAARSGVTVSALHFFERQGLITSRSTTGNPRRYRRDTLCRVALIRIAARRDPTQGGGRRARATAGEPHPDPRGPGTLARSWLRNLDRRILHLQQLRDEFTDCVACGCLSIDRCLVANRDDILGAQGPGPRRLIDG